MNQRARLILTVAVIAAVVAVVILAVALARCGQQLAPGTESPGASVATTGPVDAAEKPATPAVTAGPTRIPTEGEKAAEAVGQEYIAYRRTQAECEQAVGDGEVEACVWPDSVDLITRTEWEKLFPDTSFYLLDLAGYDEVYGYDHRLRLVAAHSGHYYTAETFDHLLAANGITRVTDENRELVAKAFALMTVPDYLEEEVVFTEWEEGEWQGEYLYDHYLEAWTKIQGLEIKWWFVFEDGWLKIITRGGISKYHTGDYIDVSFEVLPRPSSEDFLFSFRGTR
jgi:hypothetical protein